MSKNTTGHAAPAPEEAYADAPAPHVETAAMLNLARANHAHPTLPEAVKEAAMAVEKRAIHI